MRTKHEIRSYILTIYGKRRGDNPIVADIFLTDKHIRHVGDIYFYKKNQDLPENKLNVNRGGFGRIVLNMYESQLGSVIETLRRQKSLSIQYRTDLYAYLVTKSLPLGYEDD